MEDSSKIEKIAYGTDASQIKGQARKIVFPKNASEIANIIRTETNIVPRGAGTGLVGGAVPLNSLVIDLSKMHKILEIDRIRKTVYIEAGCILDDLNYELGKHSLEFPVQPSSNKVCTIGGMIATNAVGARAIRYGRTSDWVKELEVVTGNNEIHKVKPLGFSDFCGMEGITGIITKAKLKLIDKPNRTVSLFKFQGLGELIEKVRALKSIKEVSMLEFLDKASSKAIGWEEGYYLLVEFESEQGAFKGEKYEKILKERDKLYPELAGKGYSSIEDPKIQLPKLPDLAMWLEEKQIPFFGHIGAGIIHPCLNAHQIKYLDELMRLVKKLGGQITGEHGIGLKKKKYLEETEKELITRMKKRHDPLGKLNSGKIIH